MTKKKVVVFGGRENSSATLSTKIPKGIALRPDPAVQLSYDTTTALLLPAIT